MDDRFEQSARGPARGAAWLEGIRRLTRKRVPGYPPKVSERAGTQLCWVPAHTPPFDFDALAQDLAEGLSRREALRRLGAGLAGAALAGLGLATGASAAQSSCASYCKACTGAANRQCNSACLACAANPNNLCGPCGAKVCRNLASDLNNCGACGNVCPTRPNSTPTCVNSQCGFTCNPGYSTCGSASTVSGCAINLTNDVGNCGNCGNACPAPSNTAATCTNGVCGAVCLAGYADCNGRSTDGCEVDLLQDANNCGACGHQCAYGETCSSGHCTCGTSGDCAPGWTCCTGVCRNTEGDVNNCGVCGTVCPTPAHAAPVCSSGVCGSVCSAPYADCDSTVAGCETNTSTDKNNCGGCGNVCSFPNATAVCIGGGCQISGCSAGYANCDGLPGTGCETNLNTDKNNCGSCGNVCPVPANGTATCNNGVCGVACSGGYTACSGACVDVQSDDNHCGTCGTVCTTAQRCCSGVCVNYLSDFNNCGGCGNVCQNPGGAGCCNGVCTFLGSEQNCGGCGVTCSGGCGAFDVTCYRCCGGVCTNIWSDSHCGRCDHACGTAEFCLQGICY